MLTPATPPQPVPVYGGFDYVTVDAQRRRVYAAHGGSRRLLIVDADAGTVIGQVPVGPMAGVAVNPANGHVYTGNGRDGSVSEVDPVTMKVLTTVDVGGAVDAIAYDASKGRIFADEDDGTKLWVIDATTMKLVKTIALPGHKPEYLAVDPRSHDVYQNIASDAEIAVVDAAALAVKRTIPTPELKNNHPLQYDPAYHQIVVAGNGVMSAYTPAGVKIGSLSGLPSIDQCDLDPTQHVLACAGGGAVTRVQLQPSAAPTLLDSTPVNPGVHTAAIDPQTHAVFMVWATRDGSGDFVQKLITGPAAPRTPGPA